MCTATVNSAARRKAVWPTERRAGHAAKPCNHFASVCKSKPATQRQVCDIENEELLTLRNGDKVRAYCHLNVNGKSVHFMLDCGATVNVLPFVDESAVNQSSTEQS